VPARAVFLRVRHATPRGDSWHRRTKREIRQALSLRRCTSAGRVDFVGTRPYRGRVVEEASPEGSASVVLTPRAVEKVKQLRTKEGLSEAHALRVAVVGGGCSGFSYQLNFDERVQEGDRIVEYDGVRVLVDATSAQYLAGTEIDFVATLHGGGFKFSNPKATQTCGCGSSFSA